jgi:hypothetical protein
MPEIRLPLASDIVPGARVMLATNVDRYPHFIAPKGATGTVRSVDEHSVFVTMDEPLAGAEAWENAVQWWYDEHECDPRESCAADTLLLTSDEA